MFLIRHTARLGIQSLSLCPLCAWPSTMDEEYDDPLFTQTDEEIENKFISQSARERGHM